MQQDRDDCHIRRGSPMDEDGRRKAKLSHNHESVTNRDEHRDRVDDGDGPSISPEQKNQDRDARKDVANSLDPQERKRTRIGDRYTESGGCSDRVEDEVDAETNNCRWHQKSEPKQRAIPRQHRII